MAKTHPGVTFVRNPVIVRSEINSLVGDDGQAHFILDYDENGYRITQDLITYVMESLAGRVSNAYNIEVDQFFK